MIMLFVARIVDDLLFTRLDFHDGVLLSAFHENVLLRAITSGDRTLHLFLVRKHQQKVFTSAVLDEDNVGALESHLLSKSWTNARWEDLNAIKMPALMSINLQFGWLEMEASIYRAFCTNNLQKTFPWQELLQSEVKKNALCLLEYQALVTSSHVLMLESLLQYLWFYVLIQVGKQIIASSSFRMVC